MAHNPNNKWNKLLERPVLFAGRERKMTPEEIETIKKDHLGKGYVFLYKEQDMKELHTAIKQKYNDRQGHTPASATRLMTFAKNGNIFIFGPALTPKQISNTMKFRTLYPFVEKYGKFLIFLDDDQIFCHGRFYYHEEVEVVRDIRELVVEDQVPPAFRFLFDFVMWCIENKLASVGIGILLYLGWRIFFSGMFRVGFG